MKGGPSFGVDVFVYRNAEMVYCHVTYIGETKHSSLRGLSVHKTPLCPEFSLYAK